MLVGRTDTDDLLCQFRHFRVTAVNAGNESVRITCLDHHHTKRVTVHHLLASLGVGNTLAGTLLRKDTGVTMTAFRLTVVTHIDDLDALEADAFLRGDLCQAFLITQQDRNTDTFVFRLDSGLQHIDVVGLGEDYPFRMCLGHIGE